MDTAQELAGKVTVEFDESKSLPVLLQGFLQTQPDKIALIEDGQQRTYAEIIGRINQMANGLIALGIQPGDRVAMLVRNSMACAEVDKLSRFTASS